jgi:hypothetical protein
VLVDGQVAEFVDDEEGGLEIAGEFALEAAGGLGGGQGVDGERCLDPTFLRGPAYGLMPEDKRSPVASRRGIAIAAAAV